MQLIIPSFVEKLCHMRNNLIEAQLQSLLLAKKAIQLCDSIDNFITPAPGANIDSMSSMFYTLKDAMGEYARYQLKPASQKYTSDEDLRAHVIRAVDGNLWSILFNRMNIFQLMDLESRKSFVESSQKAPLEFTYENMMSTMQDLFMNRENMMIESLIQAVLRADRSYKSNDRFSFGRKIIFKNALSKNNMGTHRIEDQSAFREVLKFLSYFIMADSVKVDMETDAGVSRDFLYTQVSDAIAQSPQDISGLRIELNHGHILLFGNLNAHLVMEPQLQNYLNDVLSKTKSLKAA